MLKALTAIPRLVPVVLVAAGLLAACADAENYVERPVEELYNEAQDTVEKGDYKEAAKQFDEVERQHPYSKWATNAQVMAAYAHYRSNGYDDAIVALDRFLQLHPSHENAPYATYLKALCYYEQISDVARDQKMTQLAMQSLNEVVTRFPHSRYSRDAAVKLDLTRDHLAGKEMDIGRYYLRQQHYLAAVNRFRHVIDTYQTTTHVAEALHRLVEAYLALGLDAEARRAASVLGHNFPGSEWYIDSFEMVEGKRIRPAEQASWYEFWKGEDAPRVRPLEVEKGSAPPPGEDVAPAKKAATAEPQTGQIEKKPWWKVW